MSEATYKAAKHDFKKYIDLIYEEANNKVQNLRRKASAAILRTSYGINVDFYEKLPSGALERIETLLVVGDDLKNIKKFFKKNICDNKKDVNEVIDILSGTH